MILNENLFLNEELIFTREELDEIKDGTILGQEIAETFLSLKEFTNPNLKLKIEEEATENKNFPYTNALVRLCSAFSTDLKKNPLLKLLISCNDLPSITDVNINALRQVFTEQNAKFNLCNNLASKRADNELKDILKKKSLYTLTLKEFTYVICLVSVLSNEKGNLFKKYFPKYNSNKVHQEIQQRKDAEEDFVKQKQIESDSIKNVISYDNLFIDEKTSNNLKTVFGKHDDTNTIIGQVNYWEKLYGTDDSNKLDADSDEDKKNSSKKTSNSSGTRAFNIVCKLAKDVSTQNSLKSYAEYNNFFHALAKLREEMRTTFNNTKIPNYKSMKNFINNDISYKDDSDKTMTCKDALKACLLMVKQHSDNDSTMKILKDFVNIVTKKSSIKV